MSTPHEIVNPRSLEPPVGYSHAVVAAPGRTIYLGGQTGHRADGTLAGASLLEQFDQACANLVAALEAAGARPEDLVSLQLFVTDVEEYRSRAEPLGEAWRRHLGRHYPAAALLGVSRLWDPGAHVELVGVAVVAATGRTPR